MEDSLFGQGDRAITSSNYHIRHTQAQKGNIEPIFQETSRFDKSKLTNYTNNFDT
jgi:hypothetical protein